MEISKMLRNHPLRETVAFQAALKMLTTAKFNKLCIKAENKPEQEPMPYFMYQNKDGSCSRQIIENMYKTQTISEQTRMKRFIK